MGRYKKGDDWENIVKKVPVSICLPKVIKDSLSLVNTSEVITKILEENLDRILDESIINKYKYIEMKNKEEVVKIIRELQPRVELEIKNKIEMEYQQKIKSIIDLRDELMKTFNLMQSSLNNIESLIRELNKRIEELEDKKIENKIVDEVFSKYIKEIVISSVDKLKGGE